MIFNVNFDETESHATIIATASAMVKSSTFPAPFTDYNIEFLLNFALPKKVLSKTVKCNKSLTHAGILRHVPSVVSGAKIP